MRVASLLPLALVLAGCGASAPAAVKAKCAGVPPLTGRVMDEGAMLTAATEAHLTAELAGLEGRTRDQLVVVTLPDLGGAPIEDVALKLGRCWGIGQKGLDNGVLLVVAKADRKLRIEVGTGVEGLLKDETAGAIIREAMVPELKKGRADAAVEAGVSRIEAVLLSDTRRPRPYVAPAKA